MSEIPAVAWALREGPESPGGQTITTTEDKRVPEEPPVIACARCREPITSEGEWMEVSGARQHTFANPHGFCFRIGCFAAARALEAVGEWSGEWSWFPPCQWQVRQCAVCAEHLGWAFRAPGRSFFGLVLDRLVRLGPEGPRRL
jgi:cereblon